MIRWEVEADEFVNCNCSYGCPCQFNALPTHGFCEAVAGFAIKRGRFGDVKLDGLNAVAILQWPGPIHEGRGKSFAIVDERADAAQREALLAILSGKETKPFATVWNVFASTMETVFEPAFKRIDIAIDVESRRGHIRVDGIVDVTGEPIRNPVTGKEHRPRIDLVGGFEYEIAEIGSGTATTRGPIALSLANTYAQFAHLHLNNDGIVPSRKAAA
jgi:hypothetical protein